MDEPNINSAPSLVSMSCCHLLKMAMPDGFDFVLVVVQRDDDGVDIAMEAVGMNPYEVMQIIERCYELTREQDPIDLSAHHE